MTIDVSCYLSLICLGNYVNIRNTPNCDHLVVHSAFMTYILHSASKRQLQKSETAEPPNLVFWKLITQRKIINAFQVGTQQYVNRFSSWSTQGDKSPFSSHWVGVGVTRHPSSPQHSRFFPIGVLHMIIQTTFFLHVFPSQMLHVVNIWLHLPHTYGPKVETHRKILHTWNIMGMGVWMFFLMKWSSNPWLFACFPIVAFFLMFHGILRPSPLGKLHNFTNLNFANIKGNDFPWINHHP